MRRTLCTLALFVALATAVAGCTITIDGPDGPSRHRVGGAVDAIEWGGQPHAFYYDVTTGELRHTWYGGGTWPTEVLDGPGGPASTRAGDAVAAFVFGGQPHVVYADTAGRLLHRWYVPGAGWGWEVLDGPGGRSGGGTDHAVGRGVSATIGLSGGPHVFYQDETARALRHTYYDGATWRAETITVPPLYGASEIAYATDSGVPSNGDAEVSVVFGAQRAGKWVAFGASYTTAWQVGLPGPEGTTPNGVAVVGDLVATFDAGSRGHAAALFAAFPLIPLATDPSKTPGCGAGDAGPSVSGAVSADGATHLFYGDRGQLRHLWIGPGLTSGCEALDGVGTGPGDGRVAVPVGTPIAALAWEQTVHVFYGAFDGGGAYALRDAVIWTG